MPGRSLPSGVLGSIDCARGHAVQCQAMVCRRLISTLPFFVVCGCAVGPTYQPPELPLPDQFVNAPAATTADTSLVELRSWWKVFHDPLLERLIERAVAGNLDLKIAAARVREARAARRVAVAGLFPQADIEGSFSRSTASENAFNFRNSSQEEDMLSTSLGTVWELDLFGRIRRDVEAVRADRDAAIEAERGVLVSLLSEVASEYVEVRTLQERLRVTRANARAQAETLGLVRKRFDAGLSSELDVSRALALERATSANVPVIELQQQKALHRLAVLLGAEPASLYGELAQPGMVPVPDARIAHQLPSEVIRQRPDVRQAERELAAFTARVGVATGDLLPRFSFLASIGFGSEQGGNHFEKSSLTSSWGPAFSWPLLSWGKIQANIDAADARTEQALQRYKLAVLVALREVEDAFVAYDKTRLEAATLGESAQANRRAVELSNDLYQQGVSDFLDVLESQRNLFIAEEAQMAAQGRATQSLISLYRALGGGWDMAELEGEQPSAKEKH